MTNCFYAGYALVENIDQTVFIFENAGNDAGSYKWFGFIFKEPINLILNTSVAYQYCNLFEYINMFNQFFNIDYSSYAYEGTSWIINGILDIPPVIEQYNQLQCEGTCSCPDEDGIIPVVLPEDCDATINRYEQGRIVGAAVVKFFGTSVSPIVA